jgi:hypothetical protein
MAQSSTSRKGIYIGVILVLVIVVAALAYTLACKGSNDSTTNLKVTSVQKDYIEQFDAGDGDVMWNWNVAIKVANNGNNNANGVELVVELKAFNVTIGSGSKTFDLQSGWESTESVTIQTKYSQWSGIYLQCVATVYKNGQIADQYTTSW